MQTPAILQATKQSKKKRTCRLIGESSAESSYNEEPQTLANWHNFKVQQKMGLKRFRDCT